MAARRKRKITPHYILNLVLSAVVLGSFGLTGAKVTGMSSAATANPYGYADYCELEDGATVIYGWAADPSSTSLSGPSVTINAGGKAITVPTNRAGYRDAQVNAWIDQNRPGDPKPGTYGFRVAIPGLYKGHQYTITGIALNDGPGESVILNINTSGYTDGDTSKPYFANNQIPMGCLADAPQPAPSPSPSPTPSPTPPPKPKPSPAPSPSTNANGQVTTGTLAASIQIPADGAAKVHVQYGKDPVKLDQSTPDQEVSGDSATVKLTGLDPTSQYTYAIVRTSSGGKSTTSAPSTFNTLGFIVALHFVDSQGQGLQGIPATITAKKGVRKTSDDQGNLQFTEISAGNYTVTYTYQNKAHTKDVTADAGVVSPSTADVPHVVTIDYTVNVQKTAAAPAAAPTKDSSPWGIIIPAIVGVAAVALAIAGFIRFRKNRKYQNFYEDFPTRPLPEYQQYQPPAPPSSPPPTIPYPVETAEHTGQSLKEMVLRSMAEEAKRRESENNGGDTPAK